MRSERCSTFRPSISHFFAAAHVWQWQENPTRIWAENIAPEPRAVRITGVLLEEPAPVEGSA
ncbi:MAG: hypothetical protein ACKOAL_06440, partial [Chthoniobacterales bacterium]